ncbi:UNVERIFIED_CONTAM: hypothetical protein H355_012529, partial [Colinus virginianus]
TAAVSEQGYGESTTYDNISLDRSSIPCPAKCRERVIIQPVIVLLVKETACGTDGTTQDDIDELCASSAWLSLESNQADINDGSDNTQSASNNLPNPCPPLQRKRKRGMGLQNHGSQSGNFTGKRQDEHEPKAKKMRKGLPILPAPQLKKNSQFTSLKRKTEAQLRRTPAQSLAAKQHCETHGLNRGKEESFRPESLLQKHAECEKPSRKHFPPFEFNPGVCQHTRSINWPISLDADVQQAFSSVAGAPFSERQAIGRLGRRLGGVAEKHLSAGKMIDSVKIRRQCMLDFYSHYEHLCVVQGSAPLKAVKANLTHGTLDLTVDSIKAADWTPLLDAIRQDKTLTSIGIRSFHQQGLGESGL